MTFPEQLDSNCNVGRFNKATADLAAAVLEGWAVTRLGRRSVAVMALVLGRLCDRFDADPDVVASLVELARKASQDTAELRPN